MTAGNGQHKTVELVCPALLLLAVDGFELGLVGEGHAALDAAIVERIHDPRFEIAEEPPQIDDTDHAEPHG